MNAEIGNLVYAIEQSGPHRNATAMHDAVQEIALARGWRVFREFPVRVRTTMGNPAQGRIDLLLERDGVVVAMELDRQRPRHGSLLKLRRFGRADERIVVLRRTCARKRFDDVLVIGVAGTHPLDRSRLV